MFGMGVPKPKVEDDSEQLRDSYKRLIEIADSYTFPEDKELQKKRSRAAQLLREVGLESPIDPIELLDILESPDKLKKVVSKLKLKAFW